MKYLYLTFFIFLNSVLFAQVGINTEVPKASLDITKSSTESIPDGLLVPRMTVQDLNDKESYYGADQDGAIVYATNTAGFSGKTVNVTVPGFYYYNGEISKWCHILAENSSDSNIYNTDGTLSDERIVDMDGNILELETKAGQLKIAGNTEDALPAFDVEGRVRITKPKPLSGSTLVIDDDGNLGIETPQTLVSLMLFAQSATEQSYSTIPVNDAYNGSISAAKKVVTWTNANIASNTIATLANSSEFVFNQDGQYEVSGYINYQPNATPSGSNGFAAINVVIQYCKKGSSTWNELSLARTIWSGGFERSQTVIVPSAIAKFNAGDKVRMVFFNPFSSDGLPHGRVNGWGIKKPTGAKYTKGIKLMAL